METWPTCPHCGGRRQPGLACLDSPRAQERGGPWLQLCDPCHESHELRDAIQGAVWEARVSLVRRSSTAP